MNLLETLHQEIVQGISALPGVQHCGAFPRRMDQVTLPAVLVDLAELESTNDPGTGELALISHWEARVMVSESNGNEQDNGEVVLRSVILSVMLWLYGHTWPQKNIGCAKLKQASPDHFAPERQGHTIWLIEWTHDLRLGQSVWDGEGVIPTQIFIGSGNSFKDSGFEDSDYEEINIDGVSV